MTVTSLVLAGVGGQGTLLTSRLLAAGLIALGHEVKVSEIHGMSQRGGSVVTQVRFGPRVYAPHLGPGEADGLVAFEPAEALRHLSFLKPGGFLITDDQQIPPLPVAAGQAEYPPGVIEELRRLAPGAKVISAGRLAREMGHPRGQNIVLLGALIRHLGLDGLDWPALMAEEGPARARDLNLKALAMGLALPDESGLRPEPV
ncbi:MAG: indolepyruvate oxidoreductase subunit beta [Candidatus Adiutrix sp.]|jgi:indolepyruvate ferredoxin oxidoreductase beta subunit|nr:indolepyruvate oxidoreductase subunit beta [Candidatus Adiutrix sp.]